MLKRYNPSHAPKIRSISGDPRWNKNKFIYSVTYTAYVYKMYGEKNAVETQLEIDNCCWTFLAKYLSNLQLPVAYSQYWEMKKRRWQNGRTPPVLQSWVFQWARCDVLRFYIAWKANFISNWIASKTWWQISPCLFFLQTRTSRLNFWEQLPSRHNLSVRDWWKHRF